MIDDNNNDNAVDNRNGDVNDVDQDNDYDDHDSDDDYDDSNDEITLIIKFIMTLHQSTSSPYS